MYSYYLVAVISVLLTAVSQILLKIGVKQYAQSSVRIYLNFYTFISYSLLVVVTLINLYVFKKLPLKAALIILPSTLLVVSFLSYWLLRERLSQRQAVGAGLVIAGLLVFNI